MKSFHRAMLGSRRYSSSSSGSSHRRQLGRSLLVGTVRSLTARARAMRMNMQRAMGSLQHDAPHSSSGQSAASSYHTPSLHHIGSEYHGGVVARRPVRIRGDPPPPPSVRSRPTSSELSQVTNSSQHDISSATSYYGLPHHHPVASSTQIARPPLPPVPPLHDYSVPSSYGVYSTTASKQHRPPSYYSGPSAETNTSKKPGTLRRLANWAKKHRTTLGLTTAAIGVPAAVAIGLQASAEAN